MNRRPDGPRLLKPPPQRPGGPRFMKPPMPQCFPHDIYDPHYGETIFERLNPVPDDDLLMKALLKKVTELTPPAEDQAKLLSLVSKVQQVLDSFIINPALFSAGKIEEARQVGPHKKGTFLRGDNQAHIVVVFSTLPTQDSLPCLSIKTQSELQKGNPKDLFRVSLKEAGFDVSSDDAVTVHILITTILPNLLQLLPSTHLDEWLMQKHLISMMHSRWFEDHVSHLNIKVLIRLLVDLKRRFTGLQPLTQWMIDLFAHYCVMDTVNGQPLSITLSFRRSLELLSGGIFTEGSKSLLDPCDLHNPPIHSILTIPQQDQVCTTAQSLLRVLSHGGYDYILGFKNDIDVTKSKIILSGVEVVPSERCCEDVQDENAVFDGHFYEDF